MLTTASSVCAQQPNGILPSFDNDPLPLVHRQSLFAGYEDDRVGTVVSLSGNLLAVGVPNADSGGAVDAGRVDLYHWDSVAAAWMAIGTMGVSSANARFGAAVSISGEWLLVGCPGCTAIGQPKATLMHIPDATAGATAPHGEPAFYDATPPALEGYDDPFNGTGAAVALSVVRTGSILNPNLSIVFAVGSPQATPNQLELGAIAMGRLDLNAQQVIWEFGPAYGGAEFGRYGASLALSAALWSDIGIYLNERDLIVGEPGWVDNGASGTPGRASHWKRNGINWSLSQHLTAPTPGFLDALGSAVASERTSNDTLGTIALGAPGRNANGGGGVLVFRQSVLDGFYSFEQELQHPDAAFADRFGGALALGNGRLLIGADGRAVDVFDNAGAAYVYRRELNLDFTITWNLKQTLIELPNDDEIGGDAAFGSSVAIGPRAAAIGAPFSDAAGITNAGRTATYLCDRIFSDGVEGYASNACGGP